MPAYIGHPGALVAVPGIVTISTKDTARISTRTTLAGRVKAQSRGAERRSWNVALPRTAYPEEISPMAAFVAGEFGIGPWSWLTTWAQVTNLLTPDATVLAPGTWFATTGVATLGGAAQLQEGGRVGRTVVTDSSAARVALPYRDSVVRPIPVLPGMPVLGSAYAAGADANVRLSFLNAAGAVVGTVVGPSAGVALPGLRRVSAAGAAPATAASVYLVVTGTSQFARPALTFADVLAPWHVGQGAASVLVSEVSQESRLSTARRQLAGASFSVMEVG